MKTTTFNMTPPNLESKKQLNFKNKKTRDHFIKDIACLRFCIAMITFAAEGDDYGGDIKIPKLAKTNIDIKKIQGYTYSLKELADEICDRADNKTINQIIKINEDFFLVMLRIMSPYTNVSIPHVCGYMLEKMFNRKDVYFKLHRVNRVWGLKRIVKIFEKHGIDSSATDKFIGNSLAGALANMKI